MDKTLSVLILFSICQLSSDCTLRFSELLQFIKTERELQFAWLLPKVGIPDETVCTKDQQSHRAAIFIKINIHHLFFFKLKKGSVLISYVY